MPSISLGTKSMLLLFEQILMCEQVLANIKRFHPKWATRFRCILLEPGESKPHRCRQKVIFRIDCLWVMKNLRNKDVFASCRLGVKHCRLVCLEFNFHHFSNRANADTRLPRAETVNVMRLPKVYSCFCRSVFFQSSTSCIFEQGDYARETYYCYYSSIRSSLHYLRFSVLYLYHSHINLHIMSRTEWPDCRSSHFDARAEGHEIFMLIAAYLTFECTTKFAQGGLDRILSGRPSAALFSSFSALAAPLMSSLTFGTNADSDVSSDSWYIGSKVFAPLNISSKAEFRRLPGRCPLHGNYYDFLNFRDILNFH